MQAFGFSSTPLEPERYRAALEDPAAGGYSSFEGWVRDHNEGRRVHRLEYEAFETLAVREGERIVAEAIERFGVSRAACVHRIGSLEIGDLAVWVGVSAAHRGEAFAACRYIIDEVKHRVPIWKKEHYTDGDSGWVNCERCAAAAHDHDHEQLHGHDRGTAEHGPEAAESTAAGRESFVHDYSRQTALPEVGHAGQARLASAAVLVVGAGGLGVPVLQYLAAAGVGRLGIVDGDRVEASNLHRQPLYRVADVGRPKAVVAAESLAAINADVRLEAFETHATSENIDALVDSFDLVVECTDTFRAKFLVNDAVVRAGLPAVFASVHQYEGQLQVYRPEPDWPCLRCLWPEAPRDGLVGNCAEAGVLGPVPATLGALQAMQALKLLLGLDAADRQGLLLFDLLTLQSRWVDAKRDPACDHDVPARSAAAADGPLELEFATLDEARASGFELVDIREAWERRGDPPEASIPAHVPLSDIVNGRVEFPTGARYLIVCEHGVRSLALAEHLRAQGRADVYSMRGGMAALRV
jgi:molybdopterin/thiamine biosynthesis adenylyltransferase/molybdopterin synthase catalytic subunit/rhodanese-related sulfurtransferase